jgi:DNA-binding transcriptional LysR family regulator
LIGRKWRSHPLGFSMLPFCQGLCGSQNQAIVLLVAQSYTRTASLASQSIVGLGGISTYNGGMIRNVDTALLRAFVAAAERGGVTAAAGTLNLTQGAVSQQISRLEKLLNVRLFTRDHRGVRIAPDGERLLPRARKIVQLNDELWTQMTVGPRRERIRFGVPPDLLSEALPGFLKSLAATLPDVELTLLSVTSAEIEDALHNGRIDLALVQQRADNLSGHVLLVAPLCWVGASNGSAWQRDPIPVSTVHRTCRFREIMLSALDTHGRPWRAIFDNDGYGSMIAALRADVAISVLQASLVPAGMEIIKDHDLPDLPDFAISLHYAAHPSGALMEVVALLTSALLDRERARGNHTVQPEL